MGLAILATPLNYQVPEMKHTTMHLLKNGLLSLVWKDLTAMHKAQT